MSFLAPLAFALGALLPLVIALYFLKLRREERPVSSTYLWRTLVRDTAANAPWQRLRPNLLLLLQLLFLIVLILALARPFTWSQAAAGSHLILVVDTSASMGATDVLPSRLAHAIASARQMVAIAASPRVTVVEAGAQVRVPVSGASDRGNVFAALDALRPGPGESDMSSALTLASAMAAREPDSEIVILSDGRVTLPENLTLPGRVQYIPVGSDGNNQAILAFSLQPNAGGQNLTAFVQVVNYGTSLVQRRLLLTDDTGGRLLAARDLSLAPGQSQALTLPDLPADSLSFEAQLEGQDALTADDRAWGVAPSSGKIQARIVGPGNRFLETALSLMPNVETTVGTGEGPATGKGNQQSAVLPIASSVQLTIFDSVVPTSTLPSGSLLFLAPIRSTEFFSVTGQLDAPVPVPALAADPLLRYVDLRDLAIQDAVRVPLPSWGRAVIVDSKTDSPLLIAGEVGGRRLAVLTFDLRHSDLPLRVAFPLLVANLLGELTPTGVSDLAHGLEPGKPLDLAVPPEATSIIVHAPDGQAYALDPSAGHATFPQTGEFGVYTVSWQDQAGQPRPFGSFAVNLFSANESDIAPRASLPIAASSQQSNPEAPRARNEWWLPLAWAALLLLVFEWLWAYRGQLVRLWNLAARSILLGRLRLTASRGRGAIEK